MFENESAVEWEFAGVILLGHIAIGEAEMLMSLSVS
jgi:hypothetical protein